MIDLAKKRFSFNQNNRKKVIILVLSLLVLPLVLYFLVTGGKLPIFTGAQSDTYSMSVSQTGVVTVNNRSAFAEPATPVEVFINGSLVSTLQAPALSPGQSAEIGKVSVPANGVFKWRVTSVTNRSCDYSGEYIATPTPTACRIGYVFTRKLTSENYPRSAYIPGLLVMAHKPANSEIVKYDLYAGSPIGPTTLKDQKIKVLVVGVINQPVEARGPLTPAEMFTEAELTAIRDAYRSGMHVIAAGDNGSERAGVDDAAGELIQLNNFLQPFVAYRPTVIYVQQRQATVDVRSRVVWGRPVPLIPSVVTDTTASFRTPGVAWLTSSTGSSASTCFDQIAQGSTNTCLAYYVWPRVYSGYNVNSGFMYVDTNGGKTLQLTPNLFKNLLTEACK